jgi:hypothetical protein
MKFETTHYVIQYTPTGRFVGKQSPTYAVEEDQRSYDHLDTPDRPGHGAHCKQQWQEAHWFTEHQSAAKIFGSLTHVRRALGSARPHKDAFPPGYELNFIVFAGTPRAQCTYDLYLVCGSDGSEQTLTEVFGNY